MVIRSKCDFKKEETLHLARIPQQCASGPTLVWHFMLGHFLDTFLVPKCAFVFRHTVEKRRDLHWDLLCKTAQIGTLGNSSKQGHKVICNQTVLGSSPSAGSL